MTHTMCAGGGAGISQVWHERLVHASACMAPPDGQPAGRDHQRQGGAHQHPTQLRSVCVRVCVCVCVFESLFMHACPPKRFLHSDNHVYICVSPPPTSTHTRTYTYITHTHARTYTCSLTMHTHVHLTGLASNPDFKHPALPKLPTLLPGQAKAFTSLAFSYQVTER